MRLQLYLNNYISIVNLMEYYHDSKKILNPDEMLQPYSLKGNNCKTLIR